MVLGFVSGKYDDLAVPGEEYSFGELTAAQAGGDFLVMKDGGQSVLPLEIGNDPAAEIEAATQELIG
jgi:hypothetical protein